MVQKRHLSLSLAILFLVNVLLILCIQSGSAHAAAYRPGSTGETVRQIQSLLVDWGYFDGPVDGIYGSKTEAAVRYFQRQNGLSVDGVAGPATLAALGISAPAGDAAETRLLARVISAEARGEPYSGQVAVGAVILNRMEHPSFPPDLAGVVYQPGAFSCMDDGQFEQPIADSAYRAAREALGGSDPSGGAIYYYNPAIATNNWIRSRPVIAVIGNHTFCS